MNSQDQTLLMDFFANQLDPVQRQTLQDRMANEPDLKEAYLSMCSQLLANKAHERSEQKAALKASFQAWQEADVQPEAKVRSFSWRPLVLAAAACLALLMMVFRPWQSNPSASELALNYLQPYPIDAYRGEAEERKQALISYQNGDYASAAREISVLKQEGKATPQELLVLAICYQYLDEPSEAKAELEPLLEDDVWGQSAGWYLALANLRLGEEKLAIHQLEEISQQEDHYQRGQAQDLLSQLAK